MPCILGVLTSWDWQYFQNTLERVLKKIFIICLQFHTTSSCIRNKRREILPALVMHPKEPQQRSIACGAARRELAKRAGKDFRREIAGWRVLNVVHILC